LDFFYIVAEVREALNATGLAAHRLDIEITEGILVSKADHIIAALTKLRALGVGIALDDFGTGYSSLSYLKLLKPDKLKIDRSFVRDLPHDADDHALTQAIMAMAQALQITVVAEGVEEAAQRDLLLKLGCTLQQGYLFGKPMPAAELAARLAAAAAAASA